MLRPRLWEGDSDSMGVRVAFPPRLPVHKALHQVDTLFRAHQLPALKSERR